MNDPLAELKTAIQQSLAAPTTTHRERRTICKKFYVSPTEDQEIQHSRQGVKESRYFRAKVLGRSIPRPRPIMPQINRDTYIQIAAIRSNINQMAKAINLAVKDARSLPLTATYLNELQRVEALLVQVQLQLSQAHTVNPEQADNWQD